MNALVFLRSIGLKIFWKLIAVGLYGDGGTPAELARQEVLDFLNLCLTQEGPQTDRIVSILCEGNDYEAMDAKIKGFAALDGSDLSLQKRKWRAYRPQRRSPAGAAGAHGVLAARKRCRLPFDFSLQGRLAVCGGVLYALKLQRDGAAEPCVAFRRNQRNTTGRAVPARLPVAFYCSGGYAAEREPHDPPALPFLTGSRGAA